MYKQIFIFLAVFVFLNECIADKTKNDELVDLFRKLYQIDRKKHEEIRKLKDEPRDKISEWLFSSRYPEYRVILGINRFFMAFQSETVRKGFKGAASINRDLISDIKCTEVMNRTITFLNEKSGIVCPNLVNLWMTPIITPMPLFQYVFLADEKFDSMTPSSRSYIMYDKEKMKTQLQYTRNISQGIFVTPDVKIVKVKKESKRRMKTFLMGPSLELEMAMYTACFVLHPNKNCEIALEKKKFKLFTMGNPMAYIEQAYPVI